MARMRKLDSAFAEIKAADPDTELTKYQLRNILLSGNVPTVRQGRYRFVDMDVLEAYLTGKLPRREEPAELQTCDLKPLSENIRLLPSFKHRLT